ncbi:MAG: SPBc2 prophage-derived glycosyltransferase SunS [Chlamydiae bacterium]|nr:SPBc2 prophage-derived glycosyltransferase SunS [Chlamydiota bacterium]
MKKILLSLFLLCASLIASEKQKVCLNMIVKNESAVVKRSLGSVKPIIDYWVIVDTGSTDGTQEIIKEFMKEIPGELHERPWVNFEHNRNEALQLAKGKADYTLFIDADEELVYDKEFALPNLDKDFYYLTTEHGDTYYETIQLINDHLN